MRRRSKKYRSDKGFTLIELLVSVAILALLASIVYAGFSTVKIKAYNARVKADAALFKNAIDLYYREQGDWPPFNTTVTYATLPGGNWDVFGPIIGLNPTPTPPFPSIGASPLSIDQGYFYAQGVSLISGWKLAGTQCMRLYDGYFFDFILPSQTETSLNDGGIDPWGIEYFDGVYTIDSDMGTCN